MMLVMHMPVLVFERLVHMLVLVPFGEMQIKADRHQHAGSQQRGGQRLAEHDHRNPRADERRRREIRAGPRRAEMPQRQHEQHQADSIADKPNQRRADD